MAGWRVGMVAGHPDHLKAVLRFKSNMDSGQFLPVQLAATQALGLPADWYAGLNATYASLEKAAFALLESLDCRFDKAQQSMFVWAAAPAHYKDAFEMSDALLYQKNVFLTPGGIFGSNGKKFIRISLCSPVAVLEEAGKRMRNEE